MAVAFVASSFKILNERVQIVSKSVHRCYTFYKSFARRIKKSEATLTQYRVEFSVNRDCSAKSFLVAKLLR